MSTIIQLGIVLGIMVLVHEFGHFAVAKLCGIRVEVFSIGFGKRLFGFRRGETDYRLSLLPLGGYVKMSGDNPGEAPT
ncbi:MAG TPA: site-2 protease family protein, partial [Edaphobacter sp.]